MYCTGTLELMYGVPQYSTQRNVIITSGAGGGTLAMPLVSYIQ